MNIALRHRVPIDTSHIEIRLLRQEDIPQAVELLHRFFHETPWADKLEFSRERTAMYMTNSTTKGTQPYLLALDGDKLVGLISWHFYNEACSPIAVMDETYVLPEYRKTTLPRKLVALALYMAKGEGGAAVMNFPLASGFKETKSFVNLLRKFGAEVTGVIVTKVL